MAFDPDAFLASSGPSGGFDPDKFLKDNEDQGSSFMDKAGNVGMGALETINAPFQMAGEAIRGAGENEPLRVATADDPRGFRAPSIVQRFAPSLRTAQPPADPFEKAYQGLEGIANLPRGVQAASDVVTGPPDLAAHLGGIGLALGVMPPTAKIGEAHPGPLGEMPREIPPEAEIPKSPAAGVPPASSPPSTPLNPIKEVYSNLMDRYGPQVQAKANDVQNYITRGVKSAMGQPGAVSNLADLAQEKSQMMAVKAAGGSPLFATQGIRAGKTPIEINNELRAIGQYMLDNKIVKPELGNKLMLETQAALQEKAGNTLGAVRRMADEMHTPEDYMNQMLQTADSRLGAQYAEGLPGSAQYQTALKVVQNAKPTYQGMADAATELNRLANKANRNFQPHTPFTDLANAISHANNENIKTVVNPQVGEIYEQGLLRIWSQ